MSPRSKEQIEQIRINSIQNILGAAFKLMAQNGYESTSISQIAKEAGVSKGLAYNYFKSKKDLAEAVLMNLGDIMAQFEEIFKLSDDPYLIIEMISSRVKTVVFTSLTKFSGDKMRELLPHEYTQMAGRAGRPNFGTAVRAIFCAPT